MSTDYILIVCILLVAVLTAGGMAMRFVSRIWLRHWVEQRLRGSRAALAYLDRPHRLIIAASATSAIVLVLSGELLASEDAIAIRGLPTSLTIFAAAMIVFGQLIPRALARRFAPQFASALSPVLEAAAWLAAPVVLAGRLASRKIEDGGTERDPIQELLREGELEGLGEPQEMEIITGVMEFGEKTVAEIMVPREQIFSVSNQVSGREIAEEFATSEFSRVPVTSDSIDHVVGMIHVFDVLKLRGEERPALRPIARADSSSACSDLLFQMLKSRTHLAIVQDKSLRTVGMVTLEDLLEELVGDIRDEHDEPDAQAAHA